MKKIFMTLMSVVTIFLMAACGNSDAAQNSTNPSAQNETPTQSKILVAFFSATGNTAELAENLSKAIGADLYEIKAKDEYTSRDLDWHNENSRTTIEMREDNESVRPEIDGTVENFDGYETIIVAYPIWWNTEPRIIDTFLESYNFKGKTVIPVCTSGGSDIQQSESHMKKICPAATWKNGQRFNSRTTQDELKNSSFKP